VSRPRLFCSIVRSVSIYIGSLYVSFDTIFSPALHSTYGRNLIAEKEKREEITFPQLPANLFSLLQTRDHTELL
jgi:hypothetical protein